MTRDHNGPCTTGCPLSCLCWCHDRLTPSNKGVNGKAVDNNAVRAAIEGLAALQRRRHDQAAARRAQADAYRRLRALHTEHQQTRGSSRRLLSKP